MPRKFIVTKAIHAGPKVGDVVYEFLGYVGDNVRADEEASGIPLVAVTEDPSGYRTYMTTPRDGLTEVH